MGVLERVHLEVMRAVHEKGTMTAAAEVLHVTQSALSHSMAKLEDSLGVRVWYRDGRTLRPTQAGAYLLAAAQRLLPQLERTEVRLGQIGRGERGTLVVGMECNPCYQWLLRVTGPFLQAWPMVDLDVRQKFQFGGLAALFNHEVDLLVTPDPQFRPGIAYEAVFDYEPVLAAPLGHPLGARGWLEPPDLSNETLFTYPVSTDRLDVFASFLNPAGILPRHHTPVETTEIMLQLVAAGRGLAALPRWIVEDHARTLPVIALSLGRTGVAKQIHVGYRQEDGGTGHVESFLALAKSGA